MTLNGYLIDARESLWGLSSSMLSIDYNSSFLASLYSGSTKSIYLTVLDVDLPKVCLCRLNDFFFLSKEGSHYARKILETGIDPKL